MTILGSYVNNSIISLCQTISKINDTIFFLIIGLISKSRARDLNLLVTDMGKALQNSACFNKMPLSEYNDHCLQILQTSYTDRKLYTRTQLRIDITHFQYVISMWPCISRGPKKSKGPVHWIHGKHF